jgi:hypothetical protein
MQKAKLNLIGRRFTQITAETKKDAMRIALSDFLCTSVSKKEFPIQLNCQFQNDRYFPLKFTFFIWQLSFFNEIS